MPGVGGVVVEVGVWLAALGCNVGEYSSQKMAKIEPGKLEHWTETTPPECMSRVWSVGKNWSVSLKVVRSIPSKFHDGLFY